MTHPRLHPLRRFIAGTLILGLAAGSALPAAATGDDSARGPELLLVADASASAAAPVAASAPAPNLGPNPGVAITLALAPGVALHGAGHWYAGRPWTAAALLALEAGAVAMMVRGGSSAFAAASGPAFDTQSTSFGDSEEISRGAGLAAAGLVLFLGGWFYDLTGAPIAASETAAARAKAATPSLTFKPVVQADRAGVAVEQRF